MLTRTFLFSHHLWQMAGTNIGHTLGHEATTLKELTFLELRSLAKRLNIPNRDNARQDGKQALINLIQQHTAIVNNHADVSSLGRRLGIVNIEGKNKTIVLDEIKQILKGTPTLIESFSKQEIEHFLKLHVIPFSTTETRESLMALLKQVLINTPVNHRKRKLLATHSPAAKIFRGDATNLDYKSVFGGGATFRREYTIRPPQSSSPSYAVAAASLKTPMQNILQDAMRDFKALTVQLSVQVSKYIYSIVYSTLYYL